MKKAPIFLVCIAVAGCASAPVERPFATDEFRQIQVGMTEGEVLALMPVPSRQRHFNDGDVTWEWRDGSKAGRIVLRDGTVKAVPMPGSEPGETPLPGELTAAVAPGR